MNIHYLKALEDNYIWFIQAENQILVVDPGESQPVLDYLKEQELDLSGILLTHNHADHTDGVKAIKDVYPTIPVVGSIETKEWATNVYGEGDRFGLMNLTFQVLKTPGHTNDHIAFLVKGHLFCGDALFAAGCGRVFTGDYQAAYETIQRLQSLPEATKVYAGHEYTLTNLAFAASLTDNPGPLRQVQDQVKSQLDQGQASLPTTIKQEREWNPFMQARSLEEFTRLRQLRDQF